MSGHIQYCNHSKSAFLYHWLLVNEPQFGGFDERAHTAMMKDLKDTNNTQLFTEEKGAVNSESIRQAAQVMSDRIWEGL